jgi:hypothetical protein
MINVAIRVLFARAQAFTSLFRRLFLWEAELFDIPEEELENHQMHRMDQQHVCIDTWSDQELYDNTGFRREQIEEIYELFGLERHANTLPNTGKIRIWTGFRYCHFDPRNCFFSCWLGAGQDTTTSISVSIILEGMPRDGVLASHGLCDISMRGTNGLYHTRNWWTSSLNSGNLNRQSMRTCRKIIFGTTTTVPLLHMAG